MPTIRETASEAIANMERRESPNGTGRSGERKTAIFIKTDAPQWVGDLCYQAHGEMAPDNWRFDMIFAALLYLASEDMEDNQDSTRENLLEYVDQEVSVYNSDLLSWLASNLSRIDYVNQAVEDYGYPDDIMKVIQYGQAAEIEEVFNVVFDFLAAKVETEETTD